MPVTNYLTANGEIIGESTGGVRTDYLTDALGSVTGTVDQSASVVNTYRYKPYGELLAKTGTGSDPVFGWVGSAGYAQTGRKYAEVYVRARHYSSTNARWTSKDPIGQGGGDLNFYRYVGNRPVGRTDSSGLKPDIGSAFSKICSSVGKVLVKGYNDSEVYDRINACVSAGASGCKHVGQKELNCVAAYTCNPDKNIKVSYDDCHCKDPLLAARIYPSAQNPGIDVMGGCLKKTDGKFVMTVCSKQIVEFDPFRTGVPVTVTVLHELLHCCGIPHGNNPGSNNTCNGVMACCLLKEAGLVSRKTRCKQ